MHFVDRQSSALSPMHACTGSTSATAIYLQHRYSSTSLNKPVLSAYMLGVCALCNNPPANARPPDHGEVIARLRGRLRIGSLHEDHKRGSGAPCPAWLEGDYCPMPPRSRRVSMRKWFMEVGHRLESGRLQLMHYGAANKISHGMQSIT